MPFPEPVKLNVRRRSHFQCCLCHTLGVEVHHIVPTAEGGADTSDNAAPLCPSCHETYGSNPSKRKFVRDAREFWFGICEQRYPADSLKFDELSNQVRASLGAAAEMKAALSYMQWLLLHQLGPTPNWEFTATFQGPAERAEDLKRELQLFEPNAKVTVRARSTGTFTIDVDSPRFVPERFLVLAAERHGCTYEKSTYVG